MTINIKTLSAEAMIDNAMVDAIIEALDIQWGWAVGSERRSCMEAVIQYADGYDYLPVFLTDFGWRDRDYKARLIGYTYGLQKGQPRKTATAHYSVEEI